MRTSENNETEPSKVMEAKNNNFSLNHKVFLVFCHKAIDRRMETVMDNGVFTNKSLQYVALILELVTEVARKTLRKLITEARKIMRKLFLESGRKAISVKKS